MINLNNKNFNLKKSFVFILIYFVLIISLYFASFIRLNAGYEKEIYYFFKFDKNTNKIIELKESRYLPKKEDKYEEIESTFLNYIAGCKNIIECSNIFSVRGELKSFFLKEGTLYLNMKSNVFLSFDKINSALLEKALFLLEKTMKENHSFIKKVIFLLEDRKI